MKGLRIFIQAIYWRSLTGFGMTYYSECSETNYLILQTASRKHPGNY